MGACLPEHNIGRMRDGGLREILCEPRYSRLFACNLRRMLRIHINHIPHRKPRLVFFAEEGPDLF
jgi:hypothetical protein